MSIREIKEYLEENGIKQVWLAEKLNISTPYLSLILSGERVAPEWWKSKVGGILKKTKKEN